MGSSTKNYALIKPSEDDYFNIEDFNKNVDIIDSELKSSSDKIEVLEKNLYNPNLLINSNFNSIALINQRGLTEYTNANSYTIDMWGVSNLVNTGVKLVLESKCIRLESTSLGNGAYSDFSQPIEDATNIKNKTITITIDFEASNGSQYVFIANGIHLLSNTGDGTRRKITFNYVYTGTIPSLAHVRLLRNIDNNIGDYIKIYSIKAELGEVATYFVDDDPATKLAKCQRYLQKLDTNVHLRMAAYGPSILYFNTISLPTRMRVVPTFVYQLTEGSDYFVQSTSILPNTGFSLSIGSDGSKDLFILANKTSHGLLDGSLKFLKPILISAEM